MNDQTILYILAALGWAGVIWTQIARRTTDVKTWFSENAWGLVSGFIAVATLMLIGPGDNADLGSYMARSWAAGIGGTAAYLIGGNTPSKSANMRRKAMRSGSEESA